LIFLKAGPRDIIEIHSTALKIPQTQSTPQKMLAYHQEGQFLILELMGCLVSHYRSYTLGANSFTTPNKPKS
ncbi:MAG: response regulator, partial [Pseudomonadota bacterium]|nr:response regulator [Pseudomonadota bacterium]